MNISLGMGFVRKLKLSYYRRYLLVGLLNFGSTEFVQFFILFLDQIGRRLIIINFFGSLGLNLKACFYGYFYFLTLKITNLYRNQRC